MAEQLSLLPEPGKPPPRPPPAPPPVPPAPHPDAITLAHYAERAYLEYALSVVKGRALPDVCDGAKPVQRRILYAMARMGLSYTGTGAAGAPRPVKSARVVGDVLGRFHPHSDQAAYDALVRMAQGFSQRYPLIDGQGNFGSRDGDGAAAMRYTEARLTPIARLLIDELDEGTVNFVPNYDGSTEEPALLPARLPFVLLNGASGIAVGLATEIPSHNLREVAAAAVALVRDPALDDAALYALIPGPDFPGGGQLISSQAEIREAYASGRGSLKLRARWKIEDLARGHWQLVVTELPHGSSSQRVMEEVEELTNPKLRAGKKTLSAEQLQLKASLLAVLDAVRDESGKEAAVRLVFEPKSRAVDQLQLVNALLAHTSLESSVSLNLTMVGRDGRPSAKSLRQMLAEWLDFRQATVLRRSAHRLAQVSERIHVLEGRQLVLLNLDEVIQIIRQADDPKPALIARFALSPRQADDILDIRLRQLARLEALKIGQELAKLHDERGRLEEIVASPATLKKLLVREIEADARAHGDERRTLIQPERRTQAELRVVDEPLTVVVSDKGWVRAFKGHELDSAALAFKPGDALRSSFACRSLDSLLVFGTPDQGSGRVYSLAVAALPAATLARGEGVPLTSLIDLASGTRVAHCFAGAAGQTLLLASSDGFGLLATVADMVGRNKAGRDFLSIAAGQSLLPPAVVDAGHHRVACLAGDGRLLLFGLDELKRQGNGGKGLTLMDVDAGAPLLAAISCADALRVLGSGRGGKARDELLKGVALARHHGKRARKGLRVEVVPKPERLLPV